MSSSSEKDTSPEAAAAPGDGLPDDVEDPASTPAAGADAAPAGADGIPEGADADAEAVARAVAEEDARAAAEGDDATLEVEVVDADAGRDEEAVEEPDWHDQYLRTAAELENVRKRARRDVAAGEARGVGRVARELLPAFDDLDRAVQHLDEAAEAPADEHLATAVRTVHASLQRALTQVGIAVDRPAGEPFDPHRHEALTQQPAPEGVEPGTIVAVYQAGYRRGEDVLRAAKVVVAG